MNFADYLETPAGQESVRIPGFGIMTRAQAYESALHKLSVLAEHMKNGANIPKSEYELLAAFYKSAKSKEHGSFGEWLQNKP